MRKWMMALLVVAMVFVSANAAVLNDGEKSLKHLWGCNSAFAEPEEEEDKKIWTLSISRYGELANAAYVLQLEGDDYVLGADEMEGKTVRKEYAEVLNDILEKYDILSWDGFDGHPSKGIEILDGESFTLDISFMDGSHIYAQGDNAFPENYGPAMNDIWRIITWMVEDE